MSRAAEWRVVIADDEPSARRGVRQRLASYPIFSVVAECADGAETLDCIERLDPDVLFLDIQMPGIDGFEVIRRRTAERMPAVVFLTAYANYALRAFDAQAIDYLLKPATEARFANTMKRLTRHLRSGDGVEAEPGIMVPTNSGALVLQMREIDWIEAADNYVRVWTDTRSYLMREPLRQLEQRVQGHGFSRAHRQALVRTAAVRELKWTSDGELVAVLRSGITIPVARRRRASFLAALGR